MPEEKATLSTYAPGTYTVSAFGTDPDLQVLPTVVAGFVVNASAVPGPDGSALFALAIALVSLAFAYRAKFGLR